MLGLYYEKHAYESLNHGAIRGLGDNSIDKTLRHQGMVVRANNPSTLEAESGTLPVYGPAWTTQGELVLKTKPVRHTSSIHW